jgi:hypothetical protein
MYPQALLHQSIVCNDVRATTGLQPHQAPIVLIHRCLYTDECQRNKRFIVKLSELRCKSVGDCPLNAIIELDNIITLMTVFFGKLVL